MFFISHVGMRAWYHIQFREGVFHLGWAADWWWNAGDIEKECTESDCCTRCTSRGQYTRWYVWLINPKKEKQIDFHMTREKELEKKITNE